MPDAPTPPAPDTSAPRTVVVVAGGALPPTSPVLPFGVVAVVAADSGLEVAGRLGLVVDVVVGDMDSVDPDLLAAAEAAGTTVERHPAAKDASDLELALQRALTFGPDRIFVLGGGAGRLDHLLLGVLVLAADLLAGVEVVAHLGRARLVVTRPGRPARLIGAPGELVTLVPVGGVASGVRTGGLTFPLLGEDLGPGTTRGLSNTMADHAATVTVDEGVVLVVQPGPETFEPAATSGPAPDLPSEGAPRSVRAAPRRRRGTTRRG